MKKPAIDQELLPIAAAAERLHKSPYTIRNWLTLGKLSRCKVGGSTYVSGEEIDKLLAGALRGGTRGPIRHR